MSFKAFELRFHKAIQQVLETCVNNNYEYSSIEVHFTDIQGVFVFQFNNGDTWEDCTFEGGLYDMSNNAVMTFNANLVDEDWFHETEDGIQVDYVAISSSLAKGIRDCVKQ